MALHIEPILDDLEEYISQRLPARLAQVMADATGPMPNIPLPPPRRENYFIGEPSRFRAYIAPTVFLMADRTNRPEAMTTKEYGHTQHQIHNVLCGILVEGKDEQSLTRICYRYAEAADAVLDDVDIAVAPATPRTWSTLVHVRDIDYGVMFVPDAGERRFRKDIVLNLAVEHWDLRTPMG